MISFRASLDSDDAVEAFTRALRDEFTDLYSLDVHEQNGVLIVSRIFLKPHAQGKGIGTQIMKRLKEMADRNGWKVGLNPIFENATQYERLKKFYRNVGLKDNPDKDSMFEMISSRRLAGTQAPQTYNDMGTTTKNVRQWTVEDVPLKPLSDEEIPLKQLHVKADLLDIFGKPLEIADKVRVNSLGLANKKDHPVYMEEYKRTTATVMAIDGDKVWVVFDSELPLLKNCEVEFKLDWLDKV